MIHIKENISLLPFNTFGIDVKAKYFCEIETIETLQELLKNDVFKTNQYLVLGGGSNILFSKDFDGLVIKNNIKGKSVIENNNEFAVIEAFAGEVWHELVLFCIDNNFAGGIENLSLIPGSVGASPIQNIGAYGVEIKDIFLKLEALNIKTGQIETFTNEECKFGYRESIFKNVAKNQYIITKVYYKLDKTKPLHIEYGAIKDVLQSYQITTPTAKDISKAVCEIRESKLPNPKEIGNAGSFFKNPEIETSLYNKLKAEYPEIPSYPINETTVKVPAGWLIEKCGFKGKSFGNYGVHKNQALVLVNYGGANGNDILNLANKIIEVVYNTFGIKIINEVNFI